MAARKVAAQTVVERTAMVAVAGTLDAVVVDAVAVMVDSAGGGVRDGGDGGGSI